MGNQQSSLIGQMCYEKGQTKVTYRNACFLMCNTGEERVFSKQGLVTTVAYKMGKNQPTIYALEGSVAVGGTALQWLGNKLGLLKPHENSELLASSVFSTGDVYFVPAINGLYAPSWKSDAKGYFIFYSTNYHYYLQFFYSFTKFNVFCVLFDSSRFFLLLR